MASHKKEGVLLPNIEEGITAEEFRIQLFGWSKEVNEQGEIREMGAEKGDATYLLTPAKFLVKVEDFVPITLGALKKDFTTAKILVRHVGVKFLVISKGKPLISLTRNPEYRSAAVERLLQQAPLLVREAIVSGCAQTSQIAIVEQKQDNFAVVINRIEEMEGQLTKHQNRMWSWLETKHN